MGDVIIHDENAEIFWEGQNTLTDEFTFRLLRGIGLRQAGRPLYCAVGSKYLPLRDDPWTFKTLGQEIGRFRINGAYIDPLTGSANILTSIGPLNINTEWKELGLYDTAEDADYGNRDVTSCNALNIRKFGFPEGSLLEIGLRAEVKWTTGDTTNLIVADNTKAIEGPAQLVVTDSIFGNVGHDLLFENKSLGFKNSVHMSNRRFQCWLGITDVDLLHATNGVRIRLYNQQSVSEYWEWILTKTSTPVALVSGVNALDLYFSDATEAGSPTVFFPDHIEIKAISRQANCGFTLDQLRIYNHSGILLARTEINPSVLKQHKTTRMVTWIINPFAEVII